MSHHFFSWCLHCPHFFFFKAKSVSLNGLFVTEWPGAMFDYSCANWWVSRVSRSTQKPLGGPAQKCSRTWRFHLVGDFFFWQACLFLLHWRLSLVRAFQEAVGSGLIKPAGLDGHIQVTSYHKASSIFRLLCGCSHSAFYTLKGHQENNQMLRPKGNFSNQLPVLWNLTPKGCWKPCLPPEELKSVPYLPRGSNTCFSWEIVPLLCFKNYFLYLGQPFDWCNYHQHHDWHSNTSTWGLPWQSSG